MAKDKSVDIVLVANKWSTYVKTTYSFAWRGVNNSEIKAMQVQKFVSNFSMIYLRHKTFPIDLC